MATHKNRADTLAGDDAVLKQYEAYPYPPRDPRDEAKGLYLPTEQTA